MGKAGGGYNYDDEPDDEPRGSCPDRRTCARMGGICQCAEQEAAGLAATMGDEWAKGMYE
jgi:hypothetical protein